jgi:hypothetical protein
MHVDPRKALLVVLLTVVTGVWVWTLVAGLQADRCSTRTGGLVDKDIPRHLVFERGNRQMDCSLMTEMVVDLTTGDAIYQRCFFDASVSIENGRVRWIVAGDAKGRIQHGDPVMNVPAHASYDGGPSASLPVHFDDEGTLQFGSERCEEIPVTEAAH